MEINMSSKIIEKIGESLVCINCGLKYNDQRKHAGTIPCVDVNTSHVYRKKTGFLAKESPCVGLEDHQYWSNGICIKCGIKDERYII